MTNTGDSFREHFPTLQDSDEFFNRMLSNDYRWQRIARQLALLAVLAFGYGIVMGVYHSLAQAVASGIKVAVLFLLVLIICFPAFYIVQYILGSRLKLHQMISIVLSGFTLMLAIMISFAPILIIFLLTGGNYYFLQLLHIAVFIVAGLFGMNAVVRALKYSCERKSVYPQTGVAIFRFWVVILAFVGIQLAWNFRPFLGDRGQPFELFRDYEGNFYTALVYSVDKLIEGGQEEDASTAHRSEHLQPANEVADTVSLEELLGGDTTLGD